MANTYNYLKAVLQNLKQESSRFPFLFFILLILWCIPLPYNCNSIALALMFAYAVFTFRKINFTFDSKLILPVIFYVLMVFSVLWTLDVHASLNALSKGLPLILIPLSFLLLPNLTEKQKHFTFQYYSYGMVVFAIFYLLKAIIRFTISRDVGVFFYHELVTEDVNAIHVSVYVALAIFYFVTKSERSRRDFSAAILLMILLLLLSSKNILIIFFGLLAWYLIAHFKSQKKGKIVKWGAVFFLILGVAISQKIIERFKIEYLSNVEENSINYDIGTNTNKVYNVSVKKAWKQDQFSQNDYFPGTAFRIYQIRVFKELLAEEPIFFGGYGVNGAQSKIAQKAKSHGLFADYGKKNFHNQYIQSFAELGLLGFLLLLLMLGLNLKKALQTKDFMHISFAVLMISLFLTESFLSRQRGIVFFTIFYCLFNSATADDVPSTLKNKI